MKKMILSSEEDAVVSAGQIDRLCELFASVVRKARLKQKPAQVVIKQQGKSLAKDLLAVFKKYVDEATNLIFRTVTVNRKLTPQQMLDATGCTQYKDPAVVSTMPREGGRRVRMVFFKEGRFLSPTDLAKAFENRRLRPDLYTQAVINQADPEFAKKYPNGAQWKDPDGNYCYIAFDRWDGDERRVDVYRRDDDWGDFWWFGGVPQD